MADCCVVSEGMACVWFGKGAGHTPYVGISEQDPPAPIPAPLSSHPLHLSPHLSPKGLLLLTAQEFLRGVEQSVFCSPLSNQFGVCRIFLKCRAAPARESLAPWRPLGVGAFTGTSRLPHSLQPPFCLCIKLFPRAQRVPRPNLCSFTGQSTGLGLDLSQSCAVAQFTLRPPHLGCSSKHRPGLFAELCRPAMAGQQVRNLHPPASTGSSQGPVCVHQQRLPYNPALSREIATLWLTSLPPPPQPG